MSFQITHRKKRETGNNKKRKKQKTKRKMENLRLNISIFTLNIKCLIDQPKGRSWSDSNKNNGIGLLKILSFIKIGENRLNLSESSFSGLWKLVKCLNQLGECLFKKIR